MKPLPHQYAVSATARQTGNIQLTEGKLSLATNAPEDFDGPGGLWTPETLFVGAVSDCFCLTFRAIARAVKMDWLSITCEADGTLDKIDGPMQFTHVAIAARLEIPAGGDISKAEQLLHKAESACLISNSLTCTRSLETVILEV